MRILIVDDEEMIRSVLREYVEFEGNEAIEAADGMEAVKLCREADFDLILMDIMMPTLDGFSAVKEIKKIKDIHKYKVDILMSAICLTFMVSYFIFQLRYPYGCTQDFRYIGLFFLVGGYYFARFVTTNKNKNINIVFLVIVVTYMVSSYLMYISLGFR